MAITISYLFKTLGELIYLFFYAGFCYLNILFRAIYPPPLKSLDGEIALITGSASGIGRELTVHLAKHHPRVKLVLWDCNESQNRETAQNARIIGSTVYEYNVDITDRNQVAEIATKVKRDVGDVTILFNNAGIVDAGNFLEVSPQIQEKVIQVNLISHLWTLREFLPKMIEKNKGHIVTIASAASFGFLKYSKVYTASKHGIRGYINALQAELHDPSNMRDIKFTTVFPWFVTTPMTSHFTLTTKFGRLAYLDAKYVSDAIVRGVRQNQENVFIPGYFELFSRLMMLVPRRLLNKIEEFYVEKVEFLTTN